MRQHRSWLLARVEAVVLAAACILLLATAVVRPARSDAGLEVERVSDARSAAVRGLLALEDSERVTVVTLTGKRSPVPPRVRASPLGLSPDVRLVAKVTADAVSMGRLRGGSMKTVVRGNCSSPSCTFGSDPSYAWSPDSQRLAAAANPRRGATLLKVFNRAGRVLRSFALPAKSEGRAYHRLISWSPDGARLLLLRENNYGPRAAVVLHVGTGRLRTLARLAHCHSPSLAWSPNGRFVALTVDVTQDCGDIFSVIDAASGRPIVQCSYYTSRHSGCGGGAAWMPGGTVWAPDSRSVFGAVLVSRASQVSTWQVSTRIDRYYLTGRRTKVINPSPGWLTPRIALPSALVYDSDPKGTRDNLYLHQFATGHRELLLSTRLDIAAVRPLQRIP